MAQLPLTLLTKKYLGYKIVLYLDKLSLVASPTR